MFWLFKTKGQRELERMMAAPDMTDDADVKTVEVLGLFSERTVRQHRIDEGERQLQYSALMRELECLRKERQYDGDGFVMEWADLVSLLREDLKVRDAKIHALELRLRVVEHHRLFAEEQLETLKKRLVEKGTR